MNRLMFFILLLCSAHLWSQISPSEKLWIENGLQHSAEKSLSFENIEDLLDTNKAFKWDYFPDVVGSYNALDRESKLQSGAGIALETGYNKKIAFQLRYAVGYSNAPNISYSSDLQTKAYFMNQFGHSSKYRSMIYNDLRFRFTYRPVKYFELQTGIDRQHFGEGDRSEMRGFQSAPAPFVKIKGNIWRLQYQFIQELWSEGMFTNNYHPKGVATHYLSYKIIPSLHLGIFESVVYGMRDTLYNRGFEFEYLNPFIFFRPQEYGLGSTDNVILGTDISYQFGKNMLYGSFVIDDFFLKEIRARNRWWANKFTAQIGFKNFFNIGKHQFFNRFEANLVRPFTYSQLVDDVVYGNESLPAAHPLGANFIELYEELNWRYKHFDFTLFLQAYLKGNENVLGNDMTGGDIYVPYTIRKEDYHYTIGRGITEHRLMVGLHLAYNLHRDRWQVFLEPRIIVDNIENKFFNNTYLTVGIQRPIGANRRNY